jgi:DNA/RNA endonuclease YhcR with UshA esterase domain
VAGASYRPDVNGRPTFINFDRPFPNHTFTALVWGDRRGAFNPPPENQFGPGSRACVEGIIEVYNGRPEIEVDSPAQISLC